MKPNTEELVTKYLAEMPLVHAVKKIADIVYEMGYAQGYLEGLEANKQDGTEARN